VQGCGVRAAPRRLCLACAAHRGDRSSGASLPAPRASLADLRPAPRTRRSSTPRRRELTRVA
jgi:hypothetical protein